MRGKQKWQGGGCVGGYGEGEEDVEGRLVGVVVVVVATGGGGGGGGGRGGEGRGEGFGVGEVRLETAAEGEGTQGQGGVCEEEEEMCCWVQVRLCYETVSNVGPSSD